MNLTQLGLILGVLGLATWAAVRLLGPFASAAADRLRHRPSTGIDEGATAELRAELEAIHERLDFLERALVAARGGSSAALPPRAGEGPSSRVPTPA